MLNSLPCIQKLYTYARFLEFNSVNYPPIIRENYFFFISPQTFLPSPALFCSAVRIILVLDQQVPRVHLYIMYVQYVCTQTDHGQHVRVFI